VLRHAEAGYEIAQEEAEAAGLGLDRDDVGEVS